MVQGEEKGYESKILRGVSLLLSLRVAVMGEIDGICLCFAFLGRRLPW